MPTEPATRSVAQARDALLLWFIRKSRSGAARAVSSSGVLSRRSGVESKSEGDIRWSYFSWSRKALSSCPGNNGCDAQGVCTLPHTKPSGCRKLRRQARKSDRTPRKTREDWRAGKFNRSLRASFTSTSTRLSRSLWYSVTSSACSHVCLVP